VKPSILKFAVWLVLIFGVECITLDKSLAQQPRSKIDDLQIDWVIPNGAFSENEGKALSGDTKLSIRMVPKRLFETASEVVAADGTLLLPKGAQLYGMIGSKFRVCSQEKHDLKYASAGNRVCMQDDNGDGVLDHYFLRGMGRNFLTTDKMWFAMNGYPPLEMPELKRAEHIEIDRGHTKIAPAFSIEIYGGKRSIYTTVSFEVQNKFSGACYALAVVPDAGGITENACFVDDFQVKLSAVKGKKRKDTEFTLNAPDRDIGVRFDVISKKLWREMRGASFE
jgi:hypothetical protein